MIIMGTGDDGLWCIHTNNNRKMRSHRFLKSISCNDIITRQIVWFFLQSKCCSILVCLVYLQSTESSAVFHWNVIIHIWGAHLGFFHSSLLVWFCFEIYKYWIWFVIKNTFKVAKIPEGCLMEAIASTRSNSGESTPRHQHIKRKSHSRHIWSISHFLIYLFIILDETERMILKCGFAVINFAPITLHRFVPFLWGAQTILFFFPIFVDLFNFISTQHFLNAINIKC